MQIGGLGTNSRSVSRLPVERGGIGAATYDNSVLFSTLV